MQADAAQMMSDRLHDLEQRGSSMAPPADRITIASARSQVAAQLATAEATLELASEVRSLRELFDNAPLIRTVDS